jgi:hypothetical protein
MLERLFIKADTGFVRDLSKESKGFEKELPNPITLFTENFFNKPSENCISFQFRTHFYLKKPWKNQRWWYWRPEWAAVMED